MKHKILFRRIQAVILSVAMLTSMCTTGYAAESDNSPAESQEMAATYDLGQTDTTPEEAGAGEDRANEAQGSMGEDNGTSDKDNSPEDGQSPSENEGEPSEDPSDKGENPSQDSTNKGDNPVEDPSGKDDITSEIPSDEKGDSSASSSGKEENPETEKPSTEKPDEIKDDPNGKPGGASVTPTEKPATAPKAPVKVTEKVTDRTAVEGFLKKYDAFMEKYQEDQDAISEDKEPVNYKTWRRVRSAVVEILDMAEDLDDSEVQDAVVEIKEIFTAEAKKEFTRLTVDLFRELMGTEDEEEDDFAYDELEVMVSEGPAENFIQLVYDLIEEISTESAENTDEDEAEEGSQEHDRLEDNIQENEKAEDDITDTDSAENNDTEKDSADTGLAEDGTEGNEVLKADSVDNDESNDESETGTKANDVQKAEKSRLDTPEDTMDESPSAEEKPQEVNELIDEELMDELLSDSAISQYVKDVNRLITDMVTVLYDGEEELSAQELEKRLSRSETMANTTAGIVSILVNMLDELGFGMSLFTVDPVDPAGEARKKVKNAVRTFIIELSNINTQLQNDGYKESGKLKDAVNTARTTLMSSIYDGNDGIVYGQLTDEEKEELRSKINVFTGSEGSAFSSFIASLDVLNSEGEITSWTEFEKELGENLKDVKQNLDELKTLNLLNGSSDENEGETDSDSEPESIETLIDSVSGQYTTVSKKLLLLRKIKEFFPRIEKNLSEKSYNNFQALQEDWEEIKDIDLTDPDLSISDEEQGRLAAIKERAGNLINQKDTFIRNYDVATESNASKINASNQTDLDWENTFTLLVNLKKSLKDLYEKYPVFTDSDYSGYEDGIAKMVVNLAVVELKFRVANIDTKYEDEENLPKDVDGILKVNKGFIAEVDGLKQFRYDYLSWPNAGQGENQLTDKQKEQLKALEMQLIEVKVGILEKEVAKLEAEVEKLGKEGVESKYKDYEGYYKFTEDRETVESLLDSEDLKKLKELEDEEGTLLKGRVDEAQKKLDELEEKVAESTISPEARKIWESFKKGYEGFVSDYERQLEPDAEPLEDWKWESILKRVLDLEKVTDRLPAVFYNRTRAMCQKMREILSIEATKEVKNVLEGLKGYEAETVELSHIRERVNYGKEVLNYIIPVEGQLYEKNTLASKLEEILQHAEILKSNMEENIKVFLLAIRDFEKRVNDFMDAYEKFSNAKRAFDEKTRNKTKDQWTDDERAEHDELEKEDLRLKEVLSELTVNYKELRDKYQGYTDDDKKLVKSAYEEMATLWNSVCIQHNIKMDIKDQLYDFLEAVEELKKYYGQLSLWQNNPWNLKWAFEECWDKYENLKSQLDLLKNSATATDADKKMAESIEKDTRYKQAIEDLEEIKSAVEELFKEVTDLDQAGLYTAGKPMATGDSISVPKQTLENAREFFRLVQNMEGGLNETHARCQRMRELVMQVGTPNNATSENTGSDDTNPDDQTQDGSGSGGSSSSDVDRVSIQNEITQLLDEIDRVARTTDYDNWHGLMGGQAYAETAWLPQDIENIKNPETGEIANPMYINIAPMTTAGLELSGLNVTADDYTFAGTLEMVDNAISMISATRAELGARQNLTEHIITAMDVWAENLDKGFKVGTPSNAIGKFEVVNTKEYDAIPTNRVIGASLENAQKLINNIQVFEGTLNEMHDMLQRMNELAVKMDNGTYNDADREAIRKEMKALAEGITFLAQYVNYDDWHGLCVSADGHLKVPTGWYTCHQIDIPIKDMTEVGLFGEPAERYSVISIEAAIKKLSYNRSVLGAWQNMSEYIIELCQTTLAEGPMIGNEFKDEMGEDGKWHHVPVKLTDWFDRIYSEMRNRIYELEKMKTQREEETRRLYAAEEQSMRARIDELEAKKGNGTITDSDRQAIQQEIDALNEELRGLPEKLKNVLAEDAEHIDIEIQQTWNGVDILIDLIKTSVNVAPFVSLDPKDGMPDWGRETVIEKNETNYSYKLQYQSVESGTTDVCLVDYIENGDNTAFAGIVRGVNLKEASDREIPVIVYVQTSKSKGSDEILPQALRNEIKEKGGTWNKVNPETYSDWKYVKAIAFYFGVEDGDTFKGYSFGAETPISSSSDVSVEIQMSSIYGAKPGCVEPKDKLPGYTLYNTCDVYQSIGNSQEIKREPAAYSTEVLIGYDATDLSMPVHLPTTGGSGTMPFHMAGFAFLAVGVLMILRRRDEEEPLF